MERLLKKYIKAMKKVEAIEKELEEKYEIQIITGHKRVHVYKNIEKLSFFSGYELSKSDRDDSDYYIEKTFIVDGYVFFEIDKKEDEE